MFLDGPKGQHVKTLGHLKAHDRVVREEFKGISDGGLDLSMPPVLGTVIDLCIRADGVNIATINYDDGSCGAEIVKDGKPRKAPEVV